MYNTVVERCFMDCVGSFKRKDLEKDEEAVRPASVLPLSAHPAPTVHNALHRKVCQLFRARGLAL